MVSLLWPVQAPSLPPGPLEALLSRNQDSINLLIPPADTDRHLQWRQANREDSGHVHILEETLNQPEGLHGDLGCLFVCFWLRENIQTDTPFFNISIHCLIFSSANKEAESDEMDLAESPEQCLFDCRDCTSEAHSQMLDDGPSCDRQCILSIDGPVTVGASRPK